MKGLKQCRAAGHRLGCTTVSVARACGAAAGARGEHEGMAHKDGIRRHRKVRTAALYAIAGTGTSASTSAQVLGKPCCVPAPPGMHPPCRRGSTAWPRQCAAR